MDMANNLLKQGIPIMTYNSKKREWELHVCKCDPICYQPERSKREDMSTCEWNKGMWPEGCKSTNMLVMRCSEHCGNTVSPK